MTHVALTIEQAKLYNGSGPRIVRPKRKRIGRPPGTTPLSARKLFIIESIWQEKLFKQTAFDLGTTEGTIRVEVDRIKRRIGVQSIVGIALWWERRRNVNLSQCL
jgi:DNA-binding NarL/FixJ family response regulator